MSHEGTTSWVPNPAPLKNTPGPGHLPQDRGSMVLACVKCGKPMGKCSCR
jgi:hypothetical protein